SSTNSAIRRGLIACFGAGVGATPFTPSSGSLSSDSGMTGGGFEDWFWLLLSINFKVIAGQGWLVRLVVGMDLVVRSVLGSRIRPRVEADARPLSTGARSGIALSRPPSLPLADLK